MRPHEIYPTIPVVDSPRPRVHIRNDEAIRDLIITFDQLEPEDIEDQMWIRHLHALSYRLTTKGIDDWVN